MAKKPLLTLASSSVPATPGNIPPRELGEYGRALWDSITSSYDVSDAAGQAVLAEACASWDRAERLRQQIDRDGEVVRSKAGIRDHPALKHELAARAFVVRALARLGILDEPIRPTAGRPSGPW